MCSITPEKKLRGEPPQLLGKELSQTQLEVLRMVAQGYTYEEIGHARKRSKQTTKDRMGLVMQKLGARNRTHAVAIAMKRKLI